MINFWGDLGLNQKKNVVPVSMSQAAITFNQNQKANYISTFVVDRLSFDKQ